MSVLKKSSSRRKRGGDFLAVLLLVLIIAALSGHWWLDKAHKKNKPRPVPVKNVAPQASPKIISDKPKAKSSASSAPTLSSESPNIFPRPVRDVLEAQIALERLGVSPGPTDGAIGSQTRAAISVFQKGENLPVTGKLDADTRGKLTLDVPAMTNYIVTTNDLARLQPLGKSWSEKSRQSTLEYETVLELVAEKAHAHPALIKKLNPGLDWTNLVAGTVLQIPDVIYPEPEGKAAFVVIHLTGKFLEAFDEQTNLLVHFPCSIAAQYDKRPLGELHVLKIASPANYTFDPELFPEAPEKMKLIIPPGPNNPVGVAWIGLDKPGYGVHGTPVPEQVGRTESHGCFRLANWDAEYLLKLAWVGMPVRVEP